MENSKEFTAKDKKEDSFRGQLTPLGLPVMVTCWVGNQGLFLGSEKGAQWEERTRGSQERMPKVRDVHLPRS